MQQQHVFPIRAEFGIGFQESNLARVAGHSFWPSFPNRRKAPLAAIGISPHILGTRAAVEMSLEGRVLSLKEQLHLGLGFAFYCPSQGNAFSRCVFHAVFLYG
jgi:hypothetical protein